MPGEPHTVLPPMPSPAPCPKPGWLTPHPPLCPQSPVQHPTLIPEKACCEAGSSGCKFRSII